jgi:predicted HTH domain antitoxin
MSFLIPEELVRATHLTEAELAREIAVFLFQAERLTLGQASRLAGLRQIEFQHLLASRRIPVHYDTADFEEDLNTLRTLENA